jgi:hypothetical protein
MAEGVNDMDKTMILKRSTFTDNSTIGKLFLPEGDFFCFTLEDVIRKYKVPCKTAIPAGTYQVIINWSNRFQRPMPLLLDVPFYQGIRIHPGNTPSHTEGCLLVGQDIDRTVADRITGTFLAFEALFPKIRKMVGEGKLFIDIEGGFEAKDWNSTEV